VGELKEALAKGTAQDVIYWMKVLLTPLVLLHLFTVIFCVVCWLTCALVARTERSSNSSPPTPSTSPWRYFLPLFFLAVYVVVEEEEEEEEEM
jgi:hypothetical protein